MIHLVDNFVIILNFTELSMELEPEAGFWSLEPGGRILEVKYWNLEAGTGGQIWRPDVDFAAWGLVLD